MPSSPIQDYRSAERFTPLKLSINEVFNTFKDQPWVRHSKLIQPNPSLIGSEEYYSFHDYKGHKLDIAGPSKDIWKSSSSKASLRSVLTPKQFREKRTPCLPNSRTRSLNTERLTELTLSFRQCTPFRTLRLHCILNEYCSMFYTLQIQQLGIRPDDGIFPAQRQP